MSTCVVDTSNERCENGEHMQGVDSVVLLAVGTLPVSSDSGVSSDTSTFLS